MENIRVTEMITDSSLHTHCFALLLIGKNDLIIIPEIHETCESSHVNARNLHMWFLDTVLSFSHDTLNVHFDIGNVITRA